MRRVVDTLTLRKQPSIYRLFPFLVLAVLFPVVAIATTAPVYTAGVTAGEWASYSPVNVTYYGTKGYSAEPQYVKDLNVTVKLTDTVQSVYHSTNLTIQSVTRYENSTTRIEILNGDLMTGRGNLAYHLISGGLSVDDPVYPGPYTPTINQTVSMTYLGVSRTVNVLNITETPPNLIVNIEYIWDQNTGIILENKTLVVLPRLALDGGYVLYTDVRIQSTNVFSNPVSPDFLVTSSSPAPVTSGTSAISTVVISSINGFAGKVTLTPSVPSGLTCDPITPSSIKGSGTAQLSCRSSTPSNYIVTITATDGSTTHNTTTTITVRAETNQSYGVPVLGLSPAIFYAIIGVVLFIMTSAGVYLFLRTRSERQRKTTASSIAA